MSESSESSDTNHLISTYYVNLKSLAKRNRKVITKFYEKGLTLKHDETNIDKQYFNCNNNNNNNCNKDATIDLDDFESIFEENHDKIDDELNCSTTNSSKSLLDLCKQISEIKTSMTNTRLNIAFILEEFYKSWPSIKRAISILVVFVIVLKLTLFRQILAGLLAIFFRDCNFYFWLVNLIDQIFSFDTPEIIEY